MSEHGELTPATRTVGRFTVSAKRYTNGRPRVLSVVVGLLVALVVATGDGVASAAAQEPVVLTSDQITRALLTADDLPADEGYMPVTGSPTVTPSETGGICNGPDVFVLAERAGSTAFGTVNFFNSNPDGPYVSEVVFAFPTDAAAKEYMRAAQRQVTRCKAGWSTSSMVAPGDPPTDWTVKLRPPGKLGDQRFAYRQTGTGGGDDITREPDLPRVADQLEARVGNHVVITTRYGISEAIGTGRAELLDLAGSAVDDLEAALLLGKKSG
jgi:hypothetical protein